MGTGADRSPRPQPGATDVAAPAAPASCEEICARLSDYLDLALAGADLDAIEAHLRACVACARTARELAAVIRGLNALRCCRGRP